MILRRGISLLLLVSLSVVDALSASSARSWDIVLRRGAERHQVLAAVGDGALAKENDTSNINSQREKLSESLGTPDDCVNPTNPTPPSKKHRANPAGAEGDAAGDRGAQVPKASHIPSR